jgi:transketolase N-terminal domain/subunit
MPSYGKNLTDLACQHGHWCQTYKYTLCAASVLAILASGISPGKNSHRDAFRNGMDDKFVILSGLCKGHETIGLYNCLHCTARNF